MRGIDLLNLLTIQIIISIEFSYYRDGSPLRRLIRDV